MAEIPEFPVKERINLPFDEDVDSIIAEILTQILEIRFEAIDIINSPRALRVVKGYISELNTDLDLIRDIYYRLFDIQKHFKRLIRTANKIIDIEDEVLMKTYP
jgi:hypothetical protein